MTEVLIPDLGDFHDVEVIDVLVREGDTVAVDTPLVTLETDKATMDVPSSGAGTVSALKVKKGDRVSKGSVVLTLADDASAATGATAKGATAAAAGPAATPAGSADAARTVNLEVPDIGDFHDVEVIEVLVKAGDTIAAEAPLVTLETEKATMDVPAPAGGVIKTLTVKKGDRVSKGTALGTLETREGDGASPAPKSATSPAPTSAAAPSTASVTAPAAASAAAPARPVTAVSAAIDELGFARAYAGPSVRKLARELGVDLIRVKGSALKGRITHDDVKAWVKQALAGRGGGSADLPKVPVVDFAKFGPIEVKPLSRVQKISGPRLHASWVNLPHVTQYDDADITELEAARVRLKDEAAKGGVKLTPLAFILRATVLALQEYPLFNSSLDESGQNIVYKKYIHLGFAADTPNGLVVPVIRDADRKDVYELARELAALSEKARTGKLSGAEMQGGTFTVSSLGGIGGTSFTPIINAPEVAILGVSRSSHKPVYKDGAFIPRLMLPLSLSYDHRVIDGANGARFIVHLAQKLAGVKALLEAVP